MQNDWVRGRSYLRHLNPTSNSQQKAVHIYERLGFKAMQRVENYYGDNVERMIMECHR